MKKTKIIEFDSLNHVLKIEVGPNCMFILARSKGQSWFYRLFVCQESIIFQVKFVFGLLILGRKSKILHSKIKYHYLFKKAKNKLKQLKIYHHFFYITIVPVSSLFSFKFGRKIYFFTIEFLNVQED